MLADNLSVLRKRNKLSQEELADKLCLSRQTISKYETGETIPDILVCQKMAEIFNVSLDDLVNHDDSNDLLGIPPKGKYFFGTVKVIDNKIVIPKKAMKLFAINEGDKLIVLGDEEKGIGILKEEVLLKAMNK